MAVYTEITTSELTQFIAEYDLGSLVDYQAIAGGIENTNYFVTLKQNNEEQRYVLTLFEEISSDELPFFIKLANWIKQAGVKLPYGITDKNGDAQKTLKNRPALLQPFFQGKGLESEQIRTEHCQKIGRCLAKFHLAASDFPEQRWAQRGVKWWRQQCPLVQPHLDKETAALLKQEVTAFDQLLAKNLNLPLGIGHGDLFPDNALFQEQKLNAIIDIYNAAYSFWVYDLAIVANAWCSRSDGSINTELEQALLKAYQQVRPLQPDEIKAWPLMTRTAAMRFWLSRLLPALGLEQNQHEKTIKDPKPMQQLLEYRINHPAQIQQEH